MALVGFNKKSRAPLATNIYNKAGNGCVFGAESFFLKDLFGAESYRHSWMLLT